ncbi:UPF0182 family protein [Candidatus Poribacteria bacterium]|nr:UPF0182 family protein [Candidatus Poribacteria bacterium]
MNPDLAIAWLIFNTVFFGITFVWGIIRFRRGIWYRKLVLKVQAYLLWGIGGVALLSSISPVSYLYTEYLYFFEDVNYFESFWTLRKAKWALFFGFFTFAVIFMNVNAAIANRLCPEPREFARWTHQRTVSFHRTVFGLTVLFAIVLSIPMMSLHMDFLRFLERPTEKVEPYHLGKDINFFLFVFPIHKSVSLWIEVLLWSTCIVVGLLYNFYYRRDARSMGLVKRHIILHGSYLWLMLLGTGIWRSFVNLWNKVYTPSLSDTFSGFTGLFYADEKLAGGTYIYCLILLFIGVVVVLNIFWRKRILWYSALFISVTSYICLIHLYPLGSNFWGIRLAGDAEGVELVYLRQHIIDTRKAFDLDTIKEEKFNKGLISLEKVRNNPEIKENIQFWDRRVFYNILRNEEIERHHGFHPYADVDRYRLVVSANNTTDASTLDTMEGNSVESSTELVEDSEEFSQTDEQYRQVLIAPREIDPEPDRKEWGELKLKFTHGYGVCLAPVNVVTSRNRPDLWLKGVPITQKEGMEFEELEVTQPRIYYGEMTDDYVIANTEKPEYNVLEGEVEGSDNTNSENDDKGYHYAGMGGVRLGGFIRRLCFAVRFSSVFILRHPKLTAESRVMYWRNIGTRRNERLVSDRLSHIAPFLDFDPDPYIVIHDGQLWWMVDFYVTSNRYPNAQFYSDDTAQLEHNDLELYAEPRFKRFKKFNYIRNSGVAVVNAYHGTVDFYTDNENEVFTKIYQKIFPDLIKPINEMPEGLKAHRRFPDYLTRIQAKMYGNYHVTDESEFFENKNQWGISKEAYYSERPNHEIMPYYAMLRLPGEENLEFINMVPFTPTEKENFMKGWMVARCDPPNYGERIVYKLPEGMDVQGPKHVEDEINKNNELSELFKDLRDTNDIIKGNQHVIFIDEGILYIKPIFVKPKSEEGENGNNGTESSDPIRDLPTLKTIVVKAEDRLGADASFDIALENVFLGQSTPPSENGKDEAPSLADQVRTLLQSHQDTGKALEEIVKALENGNGSNGGVKKTVPKAGKKKKN